MGTQFRKGRGGLGTPGLGSLMWVDCLNLSTFTRLDLTPSYYQFYKEICCDSFWTQETLVMHAFVNLIENESIKQNKHTGQECIEKVTDTDGNAQI